MIIRFFNLIDKNTQIREEKKSEVGSRKSGVGSRQLPVGSWQLAVTSQSEIGSGQLSFVICPDSPDSYRGNEF